MRLANADRDDLVLDPFLGVGTTCLTCRELGYNSVGVEISPLFAMVSRVKVMDYDVNDLKKLRDIILVERFQRKKMDLDGFIRRLYPHHALEDIIFFREKLEKIQDEKLREFFTLALMNAASKVSYIYRDGAVIKIRRDRPRPPSLRKTFRHVLNGMIRDVERHPLSPAQATVLVGDARRLDFFEPESFDIVITSPPYLNKIEYTKVYEPEYELFIRDVDVNPVRSYIGVRPSDVEEILADEMPPAAQYYFRDMRMVLGEIYRVLRNGGRVIMVVGGGVFPDRVIDVDLQLAEIASDCGFQVQRIWAVNRRVATTKRVIKIGVSRESVLFLSK